MTHQGSKNKEVSSSKKELLFTIYNPQLKSVRDALRDMLYGYNRSMPRPYEDEYFADMKKDIQRYRSEISDVLSGSGRDSAMPGQKLRLMEGEVTDFENRKMRLDVQESEILDLLALVSSNSLYEWFDYLDMKGQQDFIESLRAKGADVRKVLASLGPKEQDELVLRVLSQVSERYAGSPIFKNDPKFEVFAKSLEKVKVSVAA
jgi:hypothetical protein